MRNYRRTLIHGVAAALALDGTGHRADGIELAEQADPLHRSLRSGRHDGHPCAHDLRKARRCARAANRDRVERLHTEIARILTPDIQKRLGDLGLNINEMTPAQLSALIKSDVPRLGKIGKETGARAD